MADNASTLPQNGGATTGSGGTSSQLGGSSGTSSGTSAATTSSPSSGSSGTSSGTGTASGSAATTTSSTGGAGGSFGIPTESSGSEDRSHALVVQERSRTRPNTAVVLGAAVAGAIAGGAIPFMLAGRSSEGRSSSRGREEAVASERVLIERPAQELYSFWRDFTNLPQFMENIRSVTKLDQRRSHWVIEAPAGTSVEFDSFVTEEIPGRLIAWQSDEDATVPNRGRVEFIEQAGGRSTLVRATISYDPPGGAAGRMIAKLFRREPQVQAHEDLRRFKELMEGGRVAG